MSLEKLLRIQQKARLPEVTPLCMEYETIKDNYHCDEKPILVYLTSKYIHGDTRNFIQWYADHQDIFDKKYFTSPRLKEKVFDPHKFP